MLHKAVLHLLFSVIWILQYVDIIAIQKYGCIVVTTRFKASTISRCSSFSVNTGYTFCLSKVPSYSPLPTDSLIYTEGKKVGIRTHHVLPVVQVSSPDLSWPTSCLTTSCIVFSISYCKSSLNMRQLPSTGTGLVLSISTLASSHPQAKYHNNVKV